LRLCLLDSGSEVTLIPTSYIGRREIQWTHRKIWAANGTEIPVKGWISFTANMDAVRVEICGLVTDHVAEVYLGHDWLQLNRGQWDFGKGEIMLDGRRHWLAAKKSRVHGDDASSLRLLWPSQRGHSLTYRLEQSTIVYLNGKKRSSSRGRRSRGRSRTVCSWLVRY